MKKCVMMSMALIILFAMASTANAQLLYDPEPVHLLAPEKVNSPLLTPLIREGEFNTGWDSYWEIGTSGDQFLVDETSHWAYIAYYEDQPTSQGEMDDMVSLQQWFDPEDFSDGWYELTFDIVVREGSWQESYTPTLELDCLSGSDAFDIDANQEASLVFYLDTEGEMPGWKIEFSYYMDPNVDYDFIVSFDNFLLVEYSGPPEK